MKDEDERHEMQRSYSQHHIAEILDQAHGGASDVRSSKNQLIHSDDDEEDKT